VAAVAVAICACLVLAGCERILGPREWTMQAARVDGSTYSIRVRDTSGRVDNVEIDPEEPVPQPGGPMNPPGEPNVAVISWTGGACDTETDVLIEGDGSGLVVTIGVGNPAAACGDVGVPHELRLHGSGPLPAGAIQVRLGT
jgi:hypothetical protein